MTTLRLALLSICVLILGQVHAQKMITEYGIANMYSPKFEGMRTASNEVYTSSKFTGAHRSLPFGTTVQVVRTDVEGKSVTVRINDRGAFGASQVIDLSSAAARKLGLTDATQSARVKIQVLKPGETPPPPVISQPTPQPEKPKDPIVEAPVKIADKPVADKPVADKPVADKPVADKPIEIKAPVVSDMALKNSKLYKIQVRPTASNGYGVQVGSYESLKAAYKFIGTLEEQWFTDIVIRKDPKAADAKGRYKIIIGDYSEKAQAETYKQNVQAKYSLDGFVTKLMTGVPGETVSAIRMAKLPQEEFGVQVGAYSSFESVVSQIETFQVKFFNNTLLYTTEKDGKPQYKIILGTFPSKDLAASYKASLKESHSINGFVVKLANLK